MALITAQATLYNAFKCRLVDKNISANLTATVTMGHSDPNNVGQFLDQVLPSVTRRVRNQVFRSNSDLTAQGLFGVQNLSAAIVAESSLNLVIPTYVEINWDLLEIPEGKNVTIKLEQGFVIEDRNKFPFALGLPLTADDNLITFRTPKKLIGRLQSQFTFPIGNFRTRFFNADTFAMFDPSIIARANKVGFIELESFTNLFAFYGRVRRFDSQMSARFGPIGPGDQPYLEGNGFPYATGLGFWPQGFPGITRIRSGESINNQLETALTAEAFNLPFIWTFENLSSEFTFISDITAFKGAAPVLINEFTMLSAITVDYDSAIPTLASISSLASVAKANKSASCNMTSSFALTADVGVPMTLTWEAFTTERIIRLPLSGPYNVKVSWGDGQLETFTGSGETLVSHTYGSNGIKTVQITGDLSGFGPTAQSGGAVNIPTWNQLRTVTSFGDLGLTRLDYAFAGANNLSIVPNKLPITVTSINYMFKDASSINSPGISTWNTQNVNSMRGTFSAAFGFNQNISGWDVSNVTDMFEMFRLALAFNQNISGWDVSSVTNMERMFIGPISGSTMVFDQNLSGWCVSLIPTRPSGFDDGLQSATWTAGEKPIWGTCP
jgi:surface protein